MGTILLLKDYFDNAIYRRLKELGKISSYTEVELLNTADLLTPLISEIECSTIVKDVTVEDDMTGYRQRTGSS